MRLLGRGLIGIVLSAAAILGGSIEAGAITKVQLESKTLSISNLPKGWSSDSATSSASNGLSCLKGVKPTFKHEIRAQVAFSDGSLPDLGETIETGPGIGLRYDKFTKGLRSCKAVTFKSASTTFSGTVAPITFPKTGNRSSAFEMRLSANGVNVVIDYVFFQVGSIIGLVEYANVNSPNMTLVKEFVTEAVNKVEGKPTTVPTTVTPTTVKPPAEAPTTLAS